MSVAAMNSANIAISQVGITSFLVLASVVFIIGFVGVFINKKSVINILMSIELMLLSVNINFVTFSAHGNSLDGQIFSLFILAVAAAEAAIGLAILVCYYRVKGDIEVSEIKSLNG